jgi:hypothetical protein
MAGKRGRTQGKTSATRSKVLRGRPGKRKGCKSVRRQTVVIPVKQGPQPDPTLPRLPKDCFHAVFRRRSEMIVSRMRGRIINKHCADCLASLAIDEEMQRMAEGMIERERRPMRYLCHQCLWNYYEGFSDKQKYCGEKP